MKKDHETYSFFTGKISPFLLFEMEYHSLSYIVEKHKSDNYFPDIKIAPELALIRLVSHFEAFSKHQFAAIVNILPSLLLH